MKLINVFLIHFFCFSIFPNSHMMKSHLKPNCLATTTHRLKLHCKVFSCAMSPCWGWSLEGDNVQKCAYLLFQTLPWGLYSTVQKPFWALSLYTVGFKHHKPVDFKGSAKRLCISRPSARLLYVTWNRLVDEVWVMHSLPLSFSDTSVYWAPFS